MKLYKFKNIKPFKFLLDILQNQRFYCPKYDQLNDPFEGILGVRPPEPQEKVDVKYVVELSNFWHQHYEILKNYRVCSFTKRNDEILMWGHYSAGLQGVCIEFEISEDTKGLCDVNYLSDVSTLNPNNPIEYLTNKLSSWKYEKECRFITDNPKNQYFDVRDKITKIFVGGRIQKKYMQAILNYILKNKLGLSVVQPEPNGTIRFL